MMDYYKNRYKKLYNSVNECLDKKEFQKAFHEIIDTLEIGRPSNGLDKYFGHPSIIKSFLHLLLNTDKLTPDDRQDLYPLLSEALKKVKDKNEKYFVRYRILAPGGIYPNIELGRNNCFYAVHNQLPVIWTRNQVSTDRNILDSSVINWLTRNELKLATSIMSAYEDYAFNLIFTGYNTVEVDWSCMAKVPDELKLYFLREYFELKIRSTPIGVKAWHRQPVPDSAYYEFQNFEKSFSHFKKVFDKFSIQDDLLLRTCNYFVKAKMHWENTINAEEAIANNFFCIEGCLHLLQKKYGDNKPKLNFKLLKEVFKRDIPQGESLFDFIQEGYRTRIMLVHPEPEWGAEWKPFITSEDFYDYFKISRSLINFILTDKYTDFY
jgi:hypothetical protein